MSGSGEALLVVEHVKYRNSEAGKSPIGKLLIFTDRVEWRDSASPNIVKISFGEIKGQRVSPPNKPKVQLQICMQDESQSTFVFMRPGADRDSLVRERDAAKETLQQTLVAHRQRVQQMTQGEESVSKKAELEAKRRILDKNQQLGQLYMHLVGSKLISGQDFWTDYYKTTGQAEERTGMTGAFLANIAQSDTNGLKLNLNTAIIQSIFATYPMVERKHLELVPHEMTEEEFWVKFATSHYFHREREVLPNPDDPFADCVKYDEEEMAKLIDGGPKRKRLDFGYLDDNIFAEMNAAQKPETSGTMNAKEKQKTALIRRCNYLSGRILTTQQQAATAATSTTELNGPSGAAGAAGSGAGSGASVANGTAAAKGGYAALNRWVGGGAAEDVVESAELADEEDDVQLQPIKVQDGARIAEAEHAPEAAERYRSIVLKFIDDVSEQDILEPSDDWFAPCSSSSAGAAATGLPKNGLRPPTAAPIRLDPATQWGTLAPYVADIRLVHDAVNELAKHFWTCFPPVTPELEAKLDRMEQTLKKYESTTLLEVEHRFGPEAFLHCRDMIARAHNRYAQYLARRKK